MIEFIEKRHRATTPNGGVAQLGEHLPCKQGVMGSNPIISIKRAERSGWKTGLSGLLGKKKGFEKERFPKGIQIVRWTV